jgi:outer membrane biosynthesis protein TonB
LLHGFTGIAFLASISLHALLLISLFAPRAESESSVSIAVRYQPGLADAIKAPQAPEVPNTMSSSTQSRSLHASSTTEVSGESLGLQAHYPRLSRMLGEAGRVQVEILKKQRAVVLQSSSGFKRLDESALDATEDALKVGALDNALSTYEFLTVNFVFRLKE